MQEVSLRAGPVTPDTPGTARGQPRCETPRRSQRAAGTRGGSGPARRPLATTSSNRLCGPQEAALSLGHAPALHWPRDSGALRSLQRAPSAPLRPTLPRPQPRSPGVGLFAGPQRPLTGTLAARQVHAAGWHAPAPRVPRGARARPPGTPVRLCGTSSAASPQQAVGARPAPGALWGSTAAPLHGDDRRRRGGPGLWAPSHGDGRAPPPETRTGLGPRDSEWLRGGLTRLLSGARPWP